VAETIAPGTAHRIHVIAEYIDINGDEWQVRECPTCGHRDRIQDEPFRCVTLERGDPAATHVWFRVPTLPELRQMCGDGFEAAADQALLEGKPLLSLGLAGERAEMWTLGMGLNSV